MTYRGTVHNGVVEFEGCTSLPDGTVVTIVPVAEADAGAQAEGSLFTIGRRAVSIGQSDLATNLDHYLYGHPKVSRGQP